MNQALIDTDIFSELGKGVNQAVTRHSTAYHAAFGRYTISATTVMEIVRGFQMKQATRRLHTFLANIAAEEDLPFDRGKASVNP